MAFKKGQSGNPKGRPKGTINRPTIFDYWDEEAIAEYFDFLRDNYKEDSRLMVFVGEQLMGKAPLKVGGDPDNRTPIPIMNVQRDNGDSEGRQTT